MLFCKPWTRDSFNPKAIKEIETFDEWRGIVKTGKEHTFVYFYGDSLFYAVEGEIK